MSKSTVHNRLRELRARHRWTQRDFAKRVGVTRQTIIAVEKGQYNPSVELALKIARAFQMPVKEIFWLEEQRRGELGGAEGS